MTYQILYHVKYAEESQLIYTISNAEVWGEVKGQMTSVTSWHYAENATSILEIKNNILIS
jgi:hypothetical protein